MKNSKLLIFDCDGTILDTFKLIEEVTKQTFKEVLPDIKVTLDEIHAFFGPLLDESFKKYARTDDELKQCIETYRKYNMAWHAKYVRAYPGISEMLAKLKSEGYILVIASNKVSQAIEYGLSINHLEHSFDRIVGAELLPHPKPDPEGINNLIEEYQADSAYLIGDSKFDMWCGNNVKKTNPTFKTIGVTWCKTNRDKLFQYGADYVIDQPMEIFEVLDHETV